MSDRMWPKADVDFGNFDQVGTSASPQEADLKIRLLAVI
jgi:hypothetical protein